MLYEVITESFSNINCILSGHGIDRQYNMSDIDLFFDLYKLIHHSFINMKTSGCIYNYNIIAIFRGMFHRRLYDVHRFVIRSHGKYRYLLFFTIDL